MKTITGVSNVSHKMIQEKDDDRVKRDEYMKVETEGSVEREVDDWVCCFEGCSSR